MNFIQHVQAIQASDFNIPVSNAGSNLNITNVAVQVVNFLLVLAAVVAVIYLIYSGILYLTAAGNETNADKGKKGLINAIIGIVIIVLAMVILRVVSNTANNIVQ